MKRTVKIHHLEPSGDGYELKFEWETKKKGLTNEVVGYLIDKFRNPLNHPAQYTARPIDKGDLIELVLAEGPLAGRSTVFELVSANSFRQL